MRGGTLRMSIKSLLRGSDPPRRIPCGRLRAERRRPDRQLLPEPKRQYLGAQPKREHLGGQPRRIRQRPAISSPERSRTRRECASQRFSRRGRRIQLLPYLALDRYRGTRASSGRVASPVSPAALRSSGRMAGQGHRGVRAKRGTVRFDASGSRHRAHSRAGTQPLDGPTSSTGLMT